MVTVPTYLGLFQVPGNLFHQRSIVTSSHDNVGGVVGVVSEQRGHVVLWTQRLI